MKKIIMTLMIIFLCEAAAWASGQTADMQSRDKETVSPANTATFYHQGLLTTEATSEPPGQAEDRSTEKESEPPKHGAFHRILFYIPDRVLDLFDIVRLRVRLGPGLAVGARATEPFSVFFGGYNSVYAGLPGPRLKPIVKLPVGLENYGGGGVSIFNFTFDNQYNPDYSQTEIGASFQALIAGADVDVDPIEILDFALGLVFIDIRNDDL